MATAGLKLHHHSTPTMARQKASKPIRIHEDEMAIGYPEGIMYDETHEHGTDMDESRGPDDESGATRTDDSDDSDMDESVAEDIARFEASFKGINKRYRLINRIGEGKSTLPTTTSMYSNPGRYLFDRLQGGRSPLRRLQERMGPRGEGEHEVVASEPKESEAPPASIRRDQEDLRHQ